MEIEIYIMEFEKFVDTNESKQVISNTFVTLSFVFLAMMITAVLYWSYQKTDALFITLFSMLVLTYALMMTLFIASIRKNLTVNQYKIFITASIFMTISSAILFGYFLLQTIKYFKNPTGASGSTQPTAPVPVSQSLYNYANTPVQDRPPSPYSQPY
jgi:glucan phosphoethanolaminetransferase (alkaline phosphatase superfamily)